MVIKKEILSTIISYLKDKPREFNRNTNMYKKLRNTNIVPPSEHLVNVK